MILKLLAFLCLLGAAQSQATYYCDSANITNIQNLDFYIVTRKLSFSPGYPSGMVCKFTAATNSSRQFFVEVLESRITSYDAFGILSNGRVLANHYQRLNTSGEYGVDPPYTTILTESNSVQVEFRTYSSFSASNAGVRLRVRAVSRTDCPPGWTLLGGFCFGTSNTSGPLNFVRAQLACNKMRANLLHVPSGFPGGLRNLTSQLPNTLSGSWIGLTNYLYGSTYSFVWLSRSYIPKLNVSCNGTGRQVHIDQCLSQGCVVLDYPSPSGYFAQLTSCDDEQSFICYMPLGGTDSFYSLPTTSGYGNGSGSGSGSTNTKGDSEGFNPFWLILIIGVIVIISGGGGKAIYDKHGNQIGTLHDV